MTVGGCARACWSALQRVGCNVSVVDENVAIPPWSSLSLRAARRALSHFLHKELNENIESYIKYFRPEILFVFKGQAVRGRTIRGARQRGTTCLNYFPDFSPWIHGKELPNALKEFDYVFTTKKSWGVETARSLNIKRMIHVPHGYDPEVHYCRNLSAADLARFKCEICYVGNYCPWKEEILHELLKLSPRLDIRVWGPNWIKHCRSELVRRSAMGETLYGSDYAKALSACKIALGFHFGQVDSRVKRDQVSTRTFEIPACGTFMIHERNEEISTFFEEDKEIACFSTPSELAEKIDFYLSNPNERTQMARRAHERCVPNYSYDQRVRDILSILAREKAVPH